MDRLTKYDLWKSFQTTVNTFQGGWYRPHTDFSQKVDDIQHELWVKWTNEAEKSQEARDNLIFFLKSDNRSASPAKGNFSIVKPPDDYGRFSSMSILYSGNKTLPSQEINEGKCEGWMFDEKEKAIEDYYKSLTYADVKLIDNNRWSSCLQHQWKHPTMLSPKATQINECFHVSPRDITVVVLSYYVRPVPVEIKYTTSAANRQTGAGGEIIFDESGKGDMMWPVTVKNDFIVRLGEAYGIFTREQFLTSINIQKARQ